MAARLVTLQLPELWFYQWINQKGIFTVPNFHKFYRLLKFILQVKPPSNTFSVDKHLSISFRILTVASLTRSSPFAKTCPAIQTCVYEFFLLDLTKLTNT